MQRTRFKLGDRETFRPVSIRVGVVFNAHVFRISHKRDPPSWPDHDAAKNIAAEHHPRASVDSLRAPADALWRRARPAERPASCLHKRELARLSDMQLQRSYEMYVEALALDKGVPPKAGKVQYFIEC